MENLTNTKPIIISMGEPSGISPQLCLKLAINTDFANYVNNFSHNLKLVVFGNIALLKRQAEKFNISVKLIAVDNLNRIPNFNLGELCVINFDLVKEVEIGKLDSNNSPFVVELIEQACLACLNSNARALVTAPVHKGIINDAGIKFTGHTEFLQNLCKVDQVVMMLATKHLRVALATTHLPLSKVANAITTEKLTQVIEILHSYLIKYYAIKNPNIGVCGLNPHAGESGYFGTEEIEIINPLMQKMRTRGISVSNALPADTIFTPEVLKDKDAILAMYHDQGLPTLKYAGWDNAVNITLGLPIVRTSPDHGTALELAPLGTASEKSLIASVIEADKISKIAVGV